MGNRHDNGQETPLSIERLSRLTNEHVLGSPEYTTEELMAMAVTIRQMADFYYGRLGRHGKAQMES